MEYEETPAASTMGKGCSEKSAGLSHWYRLIAGQTGRHYFDANTVVSENTPKDFIHLSKKATQSWQMRWPVSYRPCFNDTPVP